MQSHIPVLLPEVLASLRPQSPLVERLIDGTVGGGGHTRALLEAGISQALAMDRDAGALAVARRNLAAYGDRVSYHHGSYLEMLSAAESLGWASVDAISAGSGLVVHAA